MITQTKSPDDASLARVAELGTALEQYSRCSLGQFPSPVWQARLADGRTFWVKDDGRCCQPYGGNKVRKLEFAFAALQRQQKRSLVVWGDVESHTVQACGILGRKAGLEVHGVVFPYRGQSFDAPELERLRHAGVRLHPARTMLSALLLARWIGWRESAWVAPLGASTPLTTLGHVRAALELGEQVRAGLLPLPRRIYLPFATGGSVAGLLIGLGLAGGATRVVAVQTVDGTIANRRRLERLVRRTLDLLGPLKRDFDACMKRLEVIDSRYLGRSYRDVPAGTPQALAVAAEHGLSLEPAFSAKAFAALLAALPDFPDGRLLFWNTHDQQCHPASAGGPL